MSRPEELKFLYELHDDFQILPTFYILPALQAVFMSNATQNAIPGKTVSLERTLHGEQYIEIVGELPQEGVLISKPKIAEVLDKGSGAVVVTDSKFSFFFISTSNYVRS